MAFNQNSSLYDSYYTFSGAFLRSSVLYFVLVNCRLMSCFIKQFSFRSLVLISKYLSQAWVRGTWSWTSAHKVITALSLSTWERCSRVSEWAFPSPLFYPSQWRKKDLLSDCSGQEEPFHSQTDVAGNAEESFAQQSTLWKALWGR